MDNLDSNFFEAAVAVCQPVYIQAAQESHGSYAAMRQAVHDTLAAYCAYDGVDATIYAKEPQ